MQTTVPTVPIRSALIALLTSALPLAAQDPTQAGPPQGSARERMWYAPTAEDWQKPVQVVFQRTWEDAVAVAQQTGRPILVCVNMDGEIASEHYAGVRYRQPEIAKLYEPYVCVIASVYRHNPRDHDEHGHRILCPRFGSVTCGEHIAIEPLLFEKFMDGQRIAPRHIMVELDGSETYDVYYAFDTQSVFAAIEGGIANRALQPNPMVRGDRSIVERVASRDLADRRAVELAYREGDADLRRQLLEAATRHPEAAPLDLLRLAIFGLDEDLARQAREALAKIGDEGAAELIAEALRAPLGEAEREALLGRLQQIGETSPRARTLAVVHRGLSSGSAAVDAETWTEAMQGGASYSAPSRTALESELDGGAGTGDRRADAETQLRVAEAALLLALDPETAESLHSDPRTGAKYARLMFEDALRSARTAEQLGATGWRVHAVVAVASHHLGDLDTARQRAETAVPAIPSGSQDALAIATLAIFAEARHRQIVTAARARQDWPGQWLTDASAAYSVLAKHPLGTDVQVASHYDLLSNLGARGRAGRVLDEGLARFPDSATLHDCLRERTLRERGPDGLTAVYDELLAEPGASPKLPWFAGYAAIVTAEFRRRVGRGDEALAAYERAIAMFGRAAEADPDSAGSCAHFAALSLAGRARVALEAGDVERALTELLASFERRPESAASLDGLNLTPMDTGRMLRARLVTDQRSDLLERLDAAIARLGELDPALLQLPAYERAGPRGNGGAPRRRGR